MRKQKLALDARTGGYCAASRKEKLAQRAQYFAFYNGKRYYVKRGVRIHIHTHLYIQWQKSRVQQIRASSHITGDDKAASLLSNAAYF